jgi:hypothetical protein
MRASALCEKSVKKPRFGSAVTWAACPRCGFRERYADLRRERLTGLRVCERCWDPWHPQLDFQVKPDRSIEAPAEPYPIRWPGITDTGSSIPGVGWVVSNTKDPWASGLVVPPFVSDEQKAHDATRTNFTTPVPGMQNFFPSPPDYAAQVATVNDFRSTAFAPEPVGYDGVFVPSGVHTGVTTVSPATPGISLENMPTVQVRFPPNKGVVTPGVDD